MPRMKWFAPLLVLGLAGCAVATSDVEHARDRAISEDISSARDCGPTSERPGMEIGHAPIGSMRWPCQSPLAPQR